MTLVTMVTPEPVHAYDFGSYGPPVAGGEVCPNGFGLTRRIVPCVKETVITAVNDFLVPFSAFMAGTVKAACVLAIAIGGIWVASGRVNAALRDTTILFIKIFFVALMTNNFGGLFETFLNIMEDLLAMAGQYALSMSALTNNPHCPDMTGSSDPVSLLIWQQVDCAIENLIGGIFSPFTLAMGMAGFLMSALISTTAGFFVGMLGFYIVIQLVFAFAKAVYTFISAYIAFAFMVLISPMFIPCILFRVTKPYFDKWLRLTVSFILQPMIVFAYLSMLMVALDVAVFTGDGSIYVTLAGDAARQNGFELGAWLLQQEVYGEYPGMSQTVGIDQREILQKLGGPKPADSGTAGMIGDMLTGASADWAGGIYKWMGLGNEGEALRFFKVDWPTTAVNWEALGALHGAGDVTEYMIKVFTAFFMAAVVSYIFLNLLDSLPFLSAGLAGVPGGMPVLAHGQLAPPGSNFMDSFKSKINDTFKSIGK